MVVSFTYQVELIFRLKYFTSSYNFIYCNEFNFLIKVTILYSEATFGIKDVCEFVELILFRNM